MFFNFKFLFKSYLAKALLSVINNNHYCHGCSNKLIIGNGVSTINTLFNTASGKIVIGNNTIFGHNVMVLTGRHDFTNGRRKKLVTGEPEAPSSGFDISIGEGCWVASGVIIVGGVTIGNNVIIAAGSVVTKDIPSGKFVAGIPAKIIKNT